MPRVKRNTTDGYHAPFATRLRELLEEGETSQAVLAEYIGITRQAVSAYSLGTTLPDIEKLEKIAGFFQVSADYLLGRTEIKRIDAEKQAVAEYLQLSEEAIDAMKRLKYGHLEQRIEHGYKLTAQDEPLLDVLNDLIEAMDLSKVMSNLYRAIDAAHLYGNSGNHPEWFQLDDDEKEALHILESKGFISLSLSEKASYYKQVALETVRNAIDRLLDEAAATPMCEDTLDSEDA